jgi:hypothetical protein
LLLLEWKSLAVAASSFLRIAICRVAMIKSTK